MLPEPSSTAPARRNMIAAAFTLAALCFFLTIPGTATAQTHQWSQRFGDENFDWGLSVRVDGSDNLVTTGYFMGAVNFGGGVLNSAGLSDIFLAKFDKDGIHQWSKRFGSPTGDEGHGVATDKSGNVYITGRFTDAVDFGSGAMQSAGSTDIFLARFDSAGALLWSKRFGSTGGDEGASSHADTSGHVVITGFFSGSVDFGGGVINSAGAEDIFVAAYDADGSHVWSHGIGDTGEDVGNGVWYDPWGNVFATGSFNGTVDFGGGPLVSSGMSDIFLVKYGPDGLHLWSKRLGGTGEDAGRDICVDEVGSTIVTGHFEGLVNLGGSNLSSTGAADIFLVKYSSSGLHIFSSSFGGTIDDVGTGVGVDDLENIFLASYFGGTANFGGGDLTSNGSADTALAKFDENGNHVWSRSHGSTSFDFSGTLAVDGQRDVCLVGSFQQTADFGGGPLTSLGSFEMFLAKYSGTPVPVAISAFDARAFEGGVALTGEFTSNLVIRRVNVYREEVLPVQNRRGPRADARNHGGFVLYDVVPHAGGSFRYEDRDISPDRTYRYQIGVVDDDGEFLSPIASVKTQRYGTVLYPNAPNPFNPSTTIRFTLEHTVNVTLSIHDVRGRAVATLVDGVRTAGPHAVEWNGTNSAGAVMGSGVYFYRMRAGNETLTRRMVLLK